jgi:hypothetical protein
VTDFLLDVLRSLALEREQRAETLVEIGAAAIQQDWHGLGLRDALPRVNPMKTT